MRKFIIAVIIHLALLACGVSAQTISPAPDPVAESRRIDEAIKDLREQTPVSKEYDAAAAKLQQLEEQQRAAAQPLHDLLVKLYQSDAHRQYREQTAKLMAQRHDKWEDERRTMTAAAKALYASRHEELLGHNAGPIPQGRALDFNALNFPRIDGSTSTQPLNVIIASRLLGVPYGWLYPEPYGTPYHENAQIPREILLENMPGHYSPPDRQNMDFSFVASATVANPPPDAPVAQQRTAVMINSLLARNASTHDAYINLIEKRCDLNLTARLPSESELKAAKEKGVTIAYKPIARDALVFIVHHRNPVKSLTLQQVRDIYANRITTWHDLATPTQIAEWKTATAARSNRLDDKLAVTPLWRQRDSGSRELFDKLLFADNPLPEPEGGHRNLFSSGMSGPYNRVTTEPLAIGYSVYYYEHFMALSAYTRNIAIDGVEPTFDTIASGKYPLVSPVYATYRESDAPDSSGRKLMQWLLTDEGQSLIRESGYVPVK